MGCTLQPPRRKSRLQSLAPTRRPGTPLRRTKARSAPPPSREAGHPLPRRRSAGAARGGRGAPTEPPAAAWERLQQLVCARGVLAGTLLESPTKRWARGERLSRRRQPLLRRRPRRRLASPPPPDHLHPPRTLSRCPCPPTRTEALRCRPLGTTRARRWDSEGSRHRSWTHRAGGQVESRRDRVVHLRVRRRRERPRRARLSWTMCRRTARRSSE